MYRLIKKRRHKVEDSKSKLEKNEATGKRIEAQWPEVTQLSSWARQTRENNHLTELFLHGRKAHR